MSIEPQDYLQPAQSEPEKVDPREAAAAEQIHTLHQMEEYTNASHIPPSQAGGLENMEVTEEALQHQRPKYMLNVKQTRVADLVTKGPGQNTSEKGLYL